MIAIGAVQRSRPLVTKGKSHLMYVITSGQMYDLVIDQQFPDGAYAFVCDPHEGVGMQGTLTVGPTPK